MARGDPRRCLPRHRRLPGAGERPVLAARAGGGAGRDRLDVHLRRPARLGPATRERARPAARRRRGRVARAPAPLRRQRHPLHGLLPARRPLLRARRARRAGVSVGARARAARPRDHVRRLHDRARVPARGAAALRRRVAPRPDAADPARQPDRHRRERPRGRAAPEDAGDHLLRGACDAAARRDRAPARGRGAPVAAYPRALLARRGGRDRAARRLRVRVHVRRPAVRLRLPLLVAGRRRDRAAARAGRGPAARAPGTQAPSATS